MYQTSVRHHIRRKPKGGYTGVVRHDRSIKGYVDRGTTIYPANKPEEYNGYYNYNVWNVMLWLDNEEDLYKKKSQLFDDYYDGKINENKFIQEINRLGAQAKNRSDVKNKKLTDAEINELRKDILGQYKEHSEYRNPARQRLEKERTEGFRLKDAALDRYKQKHREFEEHSDESIKARMQGSFGKKYVDAETLKMYEEGQEKINKSVKALSSLR